MNYNGTRLITEYVIYLRQFNVTRTTQSYMAIHYQVNFFQFGKYVKELGKDTHYDDLKKYENKTITSYVTQDQIWSEDQN
jgi:hypothetical protein